MKTAGPNELVNTENLVGNVAGFWLGLWHGFIAPITFVVSLFKPNIGVYEVHNNGRWYDFGFLLGLMMSIGGGGRNRSLGSDLASRNRTDVERILVE